MSEQEPESFNVPADPASAFSALLDFLAPEADPAETSAGAAADGAAGAVPGQQPAPAEGAGAAAAAAAASAAGDGRQPTVQGDGGNAGRTGVPAPGVAVDTSGSTAEPVGLDALSLLPKIGELATGFETKQTGILEQKVMAAMQAEHPKYFAAINAPARTLVNTEVPSTTGTGMERIRDSSDAKDWQETMKGILLDEITSRVEKEKDDMRDVFTTVHASIDLFANNVDLIPGTKQFDRELADAFVASVSDYELKTNGKLIGYSVPVQPIVNAIRSQLAVHRAVPAAPAAAAPTPQQQKAAEQARTPQGQFDGPQAGLRSQAGQSSTGENDDASGLMSAFLRQNGVPL